MQRRTIWRSSACVIASILSLSQTTMSSAQTALGGFLENPDTASARSPMSASKINSFIPQRGLFKFPAPYNTQAIRVTNATDCNGQDCVNYAGYSYWRNMNNHVGKESMLIFLGLDHTKGGKGPTLFELNKSTGDLADLGPLFPSSNRLSWATGEGWYFSATMPTKLYINDGPRISRFDVITEELQTVVDVSSQFGNGSTIKQMHSSDDDRVHSATLLDSNYRVRGCMAYNERTNSYYFYRFTQDFDECQVDRSGDWLLIKANLDGKDGEDSVIVDLRDGSERIILDKDGAAGHSDMGHGYMIAADNWAKDANTWKVWDFNEKKLKGKKVYHNKDWSIFAPAHVSHTNARAGLPPEQQYACGSSVNNRNGVHANEIVCFNLDGSTNSLVVAPVMTDLNTSGGENEYGRFAKGNLDITGRYFLWTANMDSSRLDAFIVRIPEQLLTGESGSGSSIGSSPSRPPVVAATVPTAPKPAPTPVPPVVEKVSGNVQWQQTHNITVSGRRLTKTSGCQGCGDAGSISEQSVIGNGHMEFTVRSSWALMDAGITWSQQIPEINNLSLGLRFQSGNAEVREWGAYRSDTPYVDGDKFSITIKDNKVFYARNGAVFYSAPYDETSKRLYIGTTLYHISGTLEDVTLTQD